MTVADLIPLVPALLPGSPTRMTIYLWRTRGANGIRLAAWRVGRRLYTTQTAVDTFLRAQNVGVELPTETPTIRGRRRKRENQAALAELAEAGI